MIEQRLDQTSSIGAAWPPTEATHERIRGFYERALVADQVTESFIEQFEGYKEETRIKDGFSRLSIRAIANSEAIQKLAHSGVSLEGALPISGHDDMHVVYAFWNDSERSISDVDALGHGQTLLNVTGTPHPREDHTWVDQMDFLSSHIVDKNTPVEEKRLLIAEFTSLYDTFGYDANDVEHMLMNPDNTFAYIENEEGIISTALAERGTVDNQDIGPINLVEITEAITKEDQRGRGYYTAISGILTERLRKDPEVDILYGESNLAMIGVLKAAHANGRRFSHFDAPLYGLAQGTFGILQQNFKVEDGAEQRPYNDFALSYVPLPAKG